MAKKPKTSFLKTNFGFVLINAIIALSIGIFIVVGTMLWLGKFARHGQEIVVPDLIGLSVEEAQILAQAEGLTVQVVDSTYSRKKPLGSIVDQHPLANSMAKRDRTIYLVTNARQVRQVPVPELRDISYRQASTTLKSIGLDVEDEVIYEPSIYRDLVLDVRIGAESVEAGTRLAEGTKVTLVVGFGAGTEQVRVPELNGQNLTNARSTLLHGRLILGSVEYDEEVTEENADKFVVYEQSVSAGVEILEGSRIDLKLTTSLEKAASATQDNSEEDFF